VKKKVKTPPKPLNQRDYFAAHALVLFDFNELFDRGPKGVAAIAYEIADAMLAERAK
jgi:hypothetical protein